MNLTQTREIIQTVGIIFTLLFAVWQFRKTRQITKLDNYSKIIKSLNELRNIRINNPDLERILFENRKTWSDKKIRRRIYGVELASIFEWVYFSHKNKLISKMEWEDWLSMWKRVILKEKSMRDLMQDESVYTFSHESNSLMKKLILEVE